ncbi:MAG: LysR family transcriptional regulator, partial [Candidatus Afipia apatlaquensis]|nr:LysR family transcriptional regulator [Candidatus Afipia apatlaquensis]
MATLNYHHLRYFWAIAHEGSLTRAADRLNLSQSALSVQLGKLELQLGKPVLAINTITFWHALRTNGIRDRIEG